MRTMRALQAYWLMLLLPACGFSVDGARAQNYPAKAIRIFTSAAATNADSVARLVANELSASVGQPVVVENRPLGFSLASGVARAAPDGYTLLIWGSGLWLGPLFEEAPYDAVRDFAPIVTLGRSPTLLLVHPALPVRSVAELIKLAKARPGQLNYSSAANGGPPHVAAELFKYMANTDIVRIEYKGVQQQIVDLLSGQVHMTFGSVATWGAQIRSGRVRPLATSGAKPSLLFPDLPTVAQTLPGYESSQVLGLWAPRKTPDAIVRRLNQETVRMLSKPDVREQLLNNAQEPVGGTPEQLAEFINSELARLAKVFKNTGSKSRN